MSQAGEENAVAPKAGRSGRSWAFYVTFVLAVIGAIPTAVELFKSYQYGIPFGDVSRAEEQRRLWAKNFQCTTTMQYQRIETSEDVIVQVGACASGDVLISAMFPESRTGGEPQRIVEWISLDRLKTRAAAMAGLAGTARAQPPVR